MKNGTPVWIPHGTQAWVAGTVLETVAPGRVKVGLVLADGRVSHAAPRVVPAPAIRSRDPRAEGRDKPPVRPGRLPDLAPWR